MAVQSILRGVVDSWGTAGAGYPLGTPVVQSATLNQVAEDLNYRETTAARRTSILSMQSWSGTISGLLPTPEDGYVGSVSYSNGYATNVNSWSATISRPVLETTVLGSGSRFRTYTFGPWEISGTYNAYIDDQSGNPVVLAGATAPGGSDDDATFTLSSGDTIVTDVYTTGMTAGPTIGELPTVNYTWVGSGTSAFSGTNNIIDTAGLSVGAETISIILSDDGSSDESDASGSAFWTSVSTTVTPGTATPVEIAFQGTGALTIDPVGA